MLKVYDQLSVGAAEAAGMPYPETAPQACSHLVIGLSERF